MSGIGSLAVCLQLPSSALVQHHSLYMLGFLHCDLQSTPYLSVQHCPSAFFCAWQYQMSFRDRLEAYQLRWRRSVAEQRQRNLIWMHFHFAAATCDCVCAVNNVPFCPICLCVTFVYNMWFHPDYHCKVSIYVLIAESQLFVWCRHQADLVCQPLSSFALLLLHNHESFQPCIHNQMGLLTTNTCSCNPIVLSTFLHKTQKSVESDQTLSFAIVQ